VNSAVVAVGLMAFDAFGLDGVPIVSKCLDVSFRESRMVGLVKHLFDAPSCLVGVTEHCLVVRGLCVVRTESKHFFEVFSKQNGFVGEVGCWVVRFDWGDQLPLRVGQFL